MSSIPEAPLKFWTSWAIGDSTGAYQVTTIGLHYYPSQGAFSQRLVNVSGQWASGLMAWNAHEWDLLPAR